MHVVFFMIKNVCATEFLDFQCAAFVLNNCIYDRLINLVERLNILDLVLNVVTVSAFGELFGGVITTGTCFAFKKLACVFESILVALLFLVDVHAVDADAIVTSSVDGNFANLLISDIIGVFADRGDGVESHAGDSLFGTTENTYPEFVINGVFSILCIIERDAGLLCLSGGNGEQQSGCGKHGGGEKMFHGVHNDVLSMSKVISCQAKNSGEPP